MSRTLDQAWTTSRILRTQVELENQIAEGLKFDLTASLNPSNSQKPAILANAESDV